ncbi:prepilin-type N-terminal cleavage/methylation domain-containing protein [Acidovorax sp. 210-6]|uniref:prepilin-type N-terminal cleavage/methylation domain-containing protein n=1 Tax=Acidovorax sp. 210-6 TaxID=2699468 RepID=UPI001389A980|nr:prepilin-type N-terminal cleavage/methylation domain-containing protein [Acidovorax sp. 210-6]NCU67438.1 prepilin-type N-terminal cleavage/methylation domain-containing protein [Acidovorax sp. 210-6]
MTNKARSSALLSWRVTQGTRGIRGFSLLEALVAMAIAAMALGTLYRTVGQSSKNAVTVQERVEAAMVARSVLAGALYAEELANQSEGKTGAWRWRLQMQPAVAQWGAPPGRPSPAPQTVARVTVDVMRAEGGDAVLVWTGWKPYRAAP